MSEIQKKYHANVERQTAVIQEMNELLKNETVQRYMELSREKFQLQQEELNIFVKMKEEEYDNCHHILVCTATKNESDHVCFGCIKCGLNNYLLSYDRTMLSFRDGIKYDYLRKHYLKGEDTGVKSDLRLAMAIYAKIKEAKPDISDEDAIRYFINAYNHIRNVEVSSERKRERAKRLELGENFFAWPR